MRSVGSGLGPRSEVELFTTADESALQMTLFVRETKSAGFALSSARVCRVWYRSWSVRELSSMGSGRGGQRAGTVSSWGRGGLQLSVRGDASTG